MQNYIYFFNIKYLTYFFFTVTQIHFCILIVVELVYLSIKIKPIKKLNKMETTNITKKPSLAKSTLPYGIIYGAILLLEFVASYSLGLNSAENKGVGILMGIFNYLILPLLFIFLACNNYKNKINGGYITFGESLKAGVATSVISGLISSIGSSLIYLLIPDAKEQILEQTRVSLAVQPNMTAESLKMAVEMTEVFMRPYILIPFSILISAIIGLIFSLIIGAIVKKENPYGDFSPSQELNNVGSEQ